MRDGVLVEISAGIGEDGRLRIRGKHINVLIAFWVPDPAHDQESAPIKNDLRTKLEEPPELSHAHLAPFAESNTTGNG